MFTMPYKQTIRPETKGTLKLKPLSAHGATANENIAVGIDNFESLEEVSIFDVLTTPSVKSKVSCLCCGSLSVNLANASHFRGS